MVTPATTEVIDELAAAQAEYDAARAAYNVAQSSLENCQRAQASALHRLNVARLEKLRAEGRELQDQADSKTREYKRVLAEIEEWKAKRHKAENSIAQFEAQPQPEFPTKAERAQREERRAELENAREELLADPARQVRGDKYNILRQELLVLDEKLRAAKFAIGNLEAIVNGRGVGKFSHIPTTSPQEIASIG